MKKKQVKQTAEYKQVMKDNMTIRRKLTTSTRVVDKVRQSQFRSLSTKSAVIHREREYYKKEDQQNFHIKVKDSIDLMVKLLKEAFKRDTMIVDNLMKSHFMPSGAGLMVKTEVHADLKEF